MLAFISFRRLMLGLLILFSGGIIACAQYAGDAPAATFPSMREQSLALDAYHLFDIGVTDINADGFLDVFTVNHSARQSFLLGDGSGGFGVNQLAPLGLSQASAFPGLEDAADGPVFSDPGLYIFWRSSQLALHAHHLPPGQKISGLVTFYTPVDVQHDDNFLVEQSSVSVTPDVERVMLTFAATGDGELVVTPQPFPRVGSPILFKLDDDVPLKRAFVGSLAISPPDPFFTLMLRDRHGLAWNDFDEDGRSDLFIAGGAVRGLSGVMDLATRPYELFYQRGEAFQRVSTPKMGFYKGACPARQTGLVDFDGDGLLDVYVVCVRNTPNQLYRQLPGGKFVNVAREAGLDLADGGSFAWLDVDNDGDMDLLWAGEHGFWLYANEGDHFAPHKLDGPRIWAQHIALGDFDNDGDGDVFVASADRNLFYENDGGVLTYKPANSLGLAKTGLTAHWGDFDNDGLLDIYVAPSGLYRQTSDHHFSLTPVVLTPCDGCKSARSAWFDADNDGFLDAIVAVEEADKQWRVGYYRNQGSANHWLEVALQGAPGNSPALGARVTLTTPTGRQTSVVGWAEGSHYGSGHYRLYFGLGADARIPMLTVTWPDGSQQTFTQVAADQLLHIKYKSP